MTPREDRRVWDIERRLERRGHWQRVRTVLGVLALGAVSLWVIGEGLLWLIRRAL